MNSRKAARTVPATVSRLLKSGAFLKRPPPAFYPTLAHPPSPSLVRSLPPREDSDLPPSTLDRPTPYQLVKAKYDAGKKLRAEEEELLNQPDDLYKKTRRRPPRPANSKRSRPLPIVFGGDEIRRQFFRDHPFEAYRPKILAEGELVQETGGPQGKAWTSLQQRTTIPTAEDAIAFTENLHDSHGLTLSQAYHTSLSQFRTLRSEHETATRAATLQAKSHGAIFFGEIERGIRVEEKVLDEWVRAREIQSEIAANRGTGGAGTASTSAAASQAAPSLFTPSEAISENREVPFTGGVEYVRNFAQRGAQEEVAAEVEELSR